MSEKTIKKPRGIFSIIWRVFIALVIIIAALLLAKSMVGNKEEPPKRQARERSFTVTVMQPEFATYSPSIKSYGSIIASKNIDIRAQVAGVTQAVSNNLVAGAKVKKGELLLSIDNFNYDGAVQDAKSALSDALLQLEIAKQQLELEKLNLDVAKQQLELGLRDLERTRALHKSGSITNKALEDKEFLISQTEQSVVQKQTSLALQQSAIERQSINISRVKWNLEKAKEQLDNTKIFAPFDAIVISETAEIGRVITNNEVIAKLYQSDSLEVHFTLSDNQYGLLSGDGLVNRPLEVVWDIDPNPITVKGKIIRSGAEVNAAKGGVEIFASLAGENLHLLKPGSFVEVNINGISYSNAMKVPETAIYENNHLYVMHEGRMQKQDIEFLARDGQDIIVRANIAKNDRIITTRLAQAGDGLKVKVEGEEQPEKTKSDALITDGEQQQRAKRKGQPRDGASGLSDGAPAGGGAGGRGN